MDIGGWLRSLGLGQYEANFRDNKIDADVLPQVTAEALDDANRAIQLAPNYSFVFRGRATVYRDMGKYGTQ